MNVAAQCACDGLDIRFLCGRPRPGRRPHLALMASKRGLEVETALTLAKHRHLTGDGADVRALRGILEDTPADIIHCHMRNDTRIGMRAAAGSDTKVVRTVYEGSPDDIARGDISAMRGVGGLIAVSGAVAEHAASVMGPERVTHICCGVDLERFNPENRLPDLREAWGIGDNTRVIGVVARVQKRRRFDLLLAAFRRLLASHPQAVLVIVGRGTKRREVAEVPVEKMGIADRVVFAGYLQEKDYVGALAALDLLVYLVPGTDGSCRTVREAMAMGLPVVSSRRGILPELVEDGVTGITCGEDVEELRAAIRSVLDSPDGLADMGARARERALRDFSLQGQAKATERFYETVLGREHGGILPRASDMA